MLMTFKGVFHN